MAKRRGHAILAALEHTSARVQRGLCIGKAPAGGMHADIPRSGRSKRALFCDARDSKDGVDARLRPRSALSCSLQLPAPPPHRRTDIQSVVNTVVFRCLAKRHVHTHTLPNVSHPTTVTQPGSRAPEGTREPTRSRTHKQDWGDHLNLAEHIVILDQHQQPSLPQAKPPARRRDRLLTDPWACRRGPSLRPTMQTSP